MTTATAPSKAVVDRRGRSGQDVATRGRLAAVRAIEQNSLRVSLPGVGDVTLPPAQHLAWYGGIAVVAALGFIEWPVAVVLGVGHVLAADHHHRLLHDFGEALGEA
jgi:hypothetical protein